MHTVSNALCANCGRSICFNTGYSVLSECKEAQCANCRKNCLSLIKFKSSSNSAINELAMLKLSTAECIFLIFHSLALFLFFILLELHCVLNVCPHCKKPLWRIKMYNITELCETWMTEFPPSRRAIASSMASWKIRLEWLLIMRSMMRSAAPWLSKWHYQQTQPVASIPIPGGHSLRPMKNKREGVFIRLQIKTLPPLFSLGKLRP